MRIDSAIDRRPKFLCSSMQSLAAHLIALLAALTGSVTSGSGVPQPHASGKVVVEQVNSHLS